MRLSSLLQYVDDDPLRLSDIAKHVSWEGGHLWLFPVVGNGRIRHSPLGTKKTRSSSK
jgi:hypothetical protein